MLIFLSCLGLGLWALALALVWLGTGLALKHFKFSKRRVAEREPLPISILKPVKGAEPGLRENLESFFHLKGVKHELIISVADDDDPAIPIIEELIAKYPEVDVRLMRGEQRIGLNPKVNNIGNSYDVAANDWILISDSNVIVESNYLVNLTNSLTPQVGVLTSVVAGHQPFGLGARLEAAYLNSFYARWMFLSPLFGQPVVIGKSMLFRKHEAERFGGLKALGRYLAEDFMAGQAMRMLGHKIRIAQDPIRQPLAKYSFKQFWQRHLRWGRIRKAQAPGPFVIEPSLSQMFAGMFGALSVHELFAVSILAAFVAHLLLWFLADMLLQFALGEKIDFYSFPVWFVLSFLHFFLWIHIATGSKVDWRGRVLKLGRGGVLSG